MKHLEAIIEANTNPEPQGKHNGKARTMQAYIDMPQPCRGYRGVGPMDHIVHVRELTGLEQIQASRSGLCIDALGDADAEGLNSLETGPGLEKVI